MGSTKVKSPGPSQEERDLQSKQAATLDTQNKLLQDQLAETQKTRALMEQLMPTTPEEIASYRAIQQQEQRLTKLSLDAMEKQMSAPQTEAEKIEDEIRLLGAQRTKRAYEGNLPVSEGTLQRQKEEFATFKEAMARSGNPITGDTPETASTTTTAGAQALGSFNKRWGALMDAERRGEIDIGTSQLLQRQGLTSDIGARDFAQQSSFRGALPQAVGLLANKGNYGWEPMQAGFSQLMQGYSSALQPHQFNRNMKYNANMQTAANKAQMIAGAMQAAGTMAGTYAGSKCWVADVLFGPDSDITHAARLYANNIDNWFTRLYGKHGKGWADWLMRNEWAQPIAKPIWLWMAHEGEKIMREVSNADTIS